VVVLFFKLFQESGIQVKSIVVFNVHNFTDQYDQLKIYYLQLYMKRLSIQAHKGNQNTENIIKQLK